MSSLQFIALTKLSVPSKLQAAAITSQLSITAVARWRARRLQELPRISVPTTQVLLYFSKEALRTGFLNSRLPAARRRLSSTTIPKSSTSSKEQYRTRASRWMREKSPKCKSLMLNAANMSIWTLPSSRRFQNNFPPRSQSNWLVPNPRKIQSKWRNLSLKKLSPGSMKEPLQQNHQSLKPSTRKKK